MVFSTVGQVERRADRLPDFAQRRELIHRLRQRLRPRLQLLEQAYVLDRDNRLVGEGAQQRDLLVRERVLFLPADRDGSHRRVVAHQRHHQQRPEAGALGHKGCFRILLLIESSVTS